MLFMLDVVRKLGDIELLEEIGRGGQSVVYRGRRGGQDVAVKLQHPNRSAHGRRIWRRASALAPIQHPGLAQILSVGEEDGSLYLVMDFVEGETLERLLTKGPLDEAAVVQLAIGIASALHAVHVHGLVHGDIKPSNVILSEGRPRLIDFGFISELGETDERVMGTLRYSAPEQLRILHRPIDGRSDLYALGMMLFEAITGRPAFDGQDSAGLVGRHANEVPPDVRDLRPEISVGLARIIAKLIRKDPDDRYQSGLGLESDLQHLSDLNERLRAGEAVLLDRTGEKVARRAVSVPRAEDAARLHSAIGSAGNRGTKLQVLGELGVGKSHFVREVLGTLEDTLVLWAVASRSDTVPFGPLKEALDSFSDEARNSPNPTRHKDRIAKAAGDSAPILAAMHPSLAWALAVTPSGDLVEFASHYPRLLADFFLRLAHAYGRCVLVLHHADALDESSLEVAHHLVQRLESSPLVLLSLSVGPLNGPLDAPRARITLAPFERERVDALIAGYLGSSAPPEVCERIWARSRGNPFAVFEYLKTFLAEGVLRYEWGEWRLDLARLESVVVSVDVQTLVGQRVAELDEGPLEVLSVAALCGAHFTTGELERYGLPDLDAALLAAENAQIIERAGEQEYLFVHQAVHEAVQSRIEPTAREAIHLRLAERWGDDEAEPRAVFARAHHIMAVPLEQAGELAARACLRAGWLALESFAAEQAYGYFEHARAARSALHEARDPELEYGLALAAVRVKEREGAFESARQALEVVRTPQQRSRLHLEVGLIYKINLEMADTEASFRQAFGEVGLRYPEQSLIALLRALVVWFWGWLWVRGPREMSEEERETRRHTASLYAEAGEAAFYRVNTLSMLQSALLGRRGCVELGPSKELARYLAGTSVILSIIGAAKTSKRFSEEAEAVSKAIGNPAAQGYSLIYRAYAMQFRGEALGAVEGLKAVRHRFAKFLATKDVIAATTTYCWSLFLRGHAREALDELLSLKEELHDPSEVPEWFAIPFHAALGRVSEAEHLYEGLKRQIDPDMRWILGQLFGHWLSHLWEIGDWAAAERAYLDYQKQLGFGPRTAPLQWDLVYVAMGYVRAHRWLSEPSAENARLLSELVSTLRKLPKVPEVRAHVWVVRAVDALARERHGDFERCLNRGASDARETDNVWALFEIESLRSLAYQRSGAQQAARRCAEAAFELAVAHQWTLRVRRVRQSALLEPSTTHRSSTASSYSSGAPRSSGEPSRIQRYLDALLELSLHTAGHGNTQEQARAALDTIVSVLGAQRGLLFLSNDEGALRLLAGRDSERHDLEEVSNYSRTVVEKVALSEQPTVVSGTEQGQSLGSESIVAHDLRSVMAVPLRLHNKLLGVVYVDNRLASGVFREEDVDIFMALANHIAIALEASHLLRLELQVESESAQRRLAERLHRSVAALNARLDAASLREVLPELARGLIECDGACLLEAGDVEVIHFRDRSVGTSSGPLTIGKRQGYWLVSRPKVSGELPCVALWREAEGFLARDLDLLATFSEYAAMAFENVRLFAEMEQLAITDPLTGVFNRRHFWVLAEQEIRQSRRRSSSFCVVLMDLDHFKAVNDTYGHAAGDEALRVFVRRVQGAVREVDVLGRHGGEEFSLLLSGTEPDHGLLVAERIRAAVCASPIEFEDKVFELRVSIGVAAGSEDGSLDALLARADEALYTAKREGRDRVVMA